MRIGALSNTHDRPPTPCGARERFAPVGSETLIRPGERCGRVSGRATAVMVDLNTSEAELIEVPT
jgi:hypothetical protein